VAAAGSGRIGAAWVVPDPPAKIKPAIPIANTVRSICVSLFSMVDPLFIEAVRTTDQLKNNTSRSMNGHSGRNKMGARYYSCHRADKRALPQSVRLWHKNRIAPACRRGDRVNGGMSLLAQSGHYNPCDECPLSGVKRASRGVAERPLVTQADINHWRTSSALAHVQFDNNIAACCVSPAFFLQQSCWRAFSGTLLLQSTVRR
jgi:hypothetical protein